jgi:hypothetical protein
MHVRLIANSSPNQWVRWLEWVSAQEALRQSESFINTLKVEAVSSQISSTQTAFRAQSEHDHALHPAKKLSPSPVQP